MSMLINVMMYALMIYLIIRMFTMNKSVNKRRRVITVINQIQDKDAFFAAADDLIANAEDSIIETKTKIIKLWGMVYHNDFTGFEDLLAQIDLNALFTTKKGALSIEENEDSFFYFLLAIPNMLYGNGENELRKLVEKKIHEYDEVLNGQLTKAVSDHCTLFYDKTEDLGEEFFRSVSAGEYPGYRYSRQLIGLYKNICDTMMCKILQDRGDDISEYEGYAQGFANSGVGKRWISAIDLKIELPAEDEEPEEPEEPEELPAPEVIDAEIVEPEETDSDDIAKEEEE